MGTQILPVKETKMSKNRKFQMLFAVALIVIAFLATISAVNASAPSRADLAWPLGDTNAAEDLSDYYQRHPEQSAHAVEAVDTSDYFFRHPELQAPVKSGDLTDYYFRHPELKLR
jgi:hypothetical protein